MGNILKSSYIDVHEAARCGHIEEVRRWIDAGNPVNAQDNTQKTPLHHAAQWGQEETLDLLVSCGADVNATDFIEDTPLHFACYFGHANCVRNLTKAGAKVDAQDCYGNTPLQIFDDHVTESVVDEIRLIVREVTRPSRTMQPAKSTNITTSGGALNPKLPPIPATPLRTGGDSGNLQATNYGHSAGNENATRPGGKLDAFTAARDGKVSVLKRALEDGANVDARDDKGLTLLMRAARAGRLSTAKYLVSQGAKLGLKDTVTGFTALHFATYNCRDSVVRVLLLAGADTQARDKYGMVPGESFQPLSYLSVTAFQQRRAIRRFLSGDLQDGMDDKGKNMFPMNAPLEAYDGDHKPQYLRHESSNRLCANSEADIGPRTTNSKGPESFRGDEDDASRVGRARGKQKIHRIDAQRNDTDVRYYLRRMSLTEIPQEDASHRADADVDAAYVDDPLGDGRKGTHSPPTGDCVINYSLRRTSMQGLLYISNKLYGIYDENCNSTGAARHKDGEAAIVPGIIASSDVIGAGSGLSAQSDHSLDLAEAGQWRPRKTESGKTANEKMGRRTAAVGMGRPVPIKYRDETAIHDGATNNLAVHLNAKGESYRSPRSRDNRRPSGAGQVGAISARVKKEDQDAARSPFLPPTSSGLESIGKFDLEGASAGHLSPRHQLVETHSTSSKAVISAVSSNHKQDDRTQKIDSRGERSDRKRRHRHRKHKRGRHRERKERGTSSSSPHRHRKHKRGRHRERTDGSNSSSSSRRNRTDSDAEDMFTTSDLTAVGDVQHTLYPTSPTAKNLAPLKRVPRQHRSCLGLTEISQSTTSILSPVTTIFVKSSDSYDDGSMV